MYIHCGKKVVYCHENLFNFIKKATALMDMPFVL